MTEEDIRKLEVKYSETKIQHICVTWFRETFPNYCCPLKLFEPKN